MGQREKIYFFFIKTPISIFTVSGVTCHYKGKTTPSPTKEPNKKFSLVGRDINRCY
jgi:hypothetical protein